MFGIVPPATEEFLYQIESAAQGGTAFKFLKALVRSWIFIWPRFCKGFFVPLKGGDYRGTWK